MPCLTFGVLYACTAVGLLALEREQITRVRAAELPQVDAALSVEGPLPLNVAIIVSRI